MVGAWWEDGGRMGLALPGDPGGGRGGGSTPWLGCEARPPHARGAEVPQCRAGGALSPWQCDCGSLRFASLPRLFPALLSFPFYCMRIHYVVSEKARLRLANYFFNTLILVDGVNCCAVRNNRFPPESTFLAGSGRPPRPPREVGPRFTAMPKDYPPSLWLDLPGQGGWEDCVPPFPNAPSLA